MKKIFFSTFIFLVCAFSFTRCFGGIDKRGSVKSHKDGVVKTVGGRFAIGKLPPSWQERKIQPKALLFYNRLDSSTITVSSWCRRAFDDGTPEALSEELYSALAAVQVIGTQNVPIDGSSARMTASTGEVDGKSVYLKTYVLKKRGCVFDFVYVSSPEKVGAEPDFDALVRGFQYLTGPGVL